MRIRMSAVRSQISREVFRVLSTECARSMLEMCVEYGILWAKWMRHVTRAERCNSCRRERERERSWSGSSLSPMSPCQYCARKLPGHSALALTRRFLGSPCNYEGNYIRIPPLRFRWWWDADVVILAWNLSRGLRM